MSVVNFNIGKYPKCELKVLAIKTAIWYMHQGTTRLKLVVLKTKLYHMNIASPYHTQVAIAITYAQTSCVSSPRPE